MQTIQQRETIISQWFQMWLQREDTGMEKIFSPHSVYIESWGPEYHGLSKIQLWFREWNTRGRVEQWDIGEFFHKGDETIVTWSFRCAMNTEPPQSFDGLSLIRWDEQGRICFLQEFGCNQNRYDPYAHGETPQFQGESPLWF